MNEINEFESIWIEVNELQFDIRNDPWLIEDTSDSMIIDCNKLSWLIVNDLNCCNELDWMINCCNSVNRSISNVVKSISLHVLDRIVIDCTSEFKSINCW